MPNNKTTATKVDNAPRIQRTEKRKALNVDKNKAAALANAEFKNHETGLLNPQHRKSNKGNGLPDRPSQIKRAVSRIGKTQQEAK